MQIEQLLTSFSIEPTKNRQQVLEILMQQNEPLDIASILSSLAKKHSKMDRVTVFRIINLFVDKGLVNKLEFNEGKARYELATRHHHHLICTECGYVECLEMCEIEALEEKISKSKDFKVQSHRLEFFGTCAHCK